MTSPEDRWIGLTEKTTRVEPDEAASTFSALGPVTSDVLTWGTGEWVGYGIDTGHPGKAQLARIKWAGKTFRTTEDVDPIVVHDDEGRREVSKDWGYARLREMKYGEGNTIAMVYDNVPIIDYFHYVSDDMVAGVMDAKTDASDSPFYFYLKRVPSGNLSTKL